ncbi:hypothetical protein PanWU01x14_231510 [Parasponia andersonii]|uniref:Uncharacterized protein n=1 Tax=Parasponia andersonii TaxID=3476 RepID=A0A2P5BKI4_PARAD|nr:hypothetical protein PanWU01x14_231510 [Parasponia andersonii]
MAADMQSRRRKSIFRIVCSSLVGNQKVPTDQIIQQAPENRQEGSIVVKRFQVLSKPRSMN